MSEHVAVVKWARHDEISNAIARSLVHHNKQVVQFDADSVIPPEADLIFTFAPYGRFAPIIRQIASRPVGQRPRFVHWNTENIPDPRIPGHIVRPMARLRSYLDRLTDTAGPAPRHLVPTRLTAAINQRAFRLRYLGDYLYAHERGSLTRLFDSSAIFADYLRQHELPVSFQPWPLLPDTFSDLSSVRDIDVFWMGKPRTKRRADLLKSIQQGLEARGYSMLLADGLQHPFVFGDARIQLLNRSKVTLSLTTQWYDNVMQFRMPLAAANRSLLITERELSHVPLWVKNRHYIAAAPEQLIDTIVRYLQSENERQRIVEQAYELVMARFRFSDAIAAMLQLLDYE